MRTGHSAIVEWIQHLEPDSFYVNAEVCDLRERIAEAPDAKLHIWNFENISLDMALEFSPHSADCFVVTRDFRNWLASALLRVVRMSIKTNFSAGILYKPEVTLEHIRTRLDVLTAVWVDNLDDALEMPSAVLVNYNAWHTSADYRRHLAERLGLPYREGGRDKVISHSSFDQARYDGRGSAMKTLTRWKRLANVPIYRNFLARYSHAVEASDEFFHESSIRA
jgi:hypothetical protein